MIDPRYKVCIQSEDGRIVWCVVGGNGAVVRHEAPVPDSDEDKSGLARQIVATVNKAFADLGSDSAMSGFDAAVSVHTITDPESTTTGVTIGGYW